MNNRFASRLLDRLDPYEPGAQPTPGQEVVKLNTNEFPYRPSPKVIDRIKREADGPLGRYPDPDGNELREAVAEAEGVVPEQVIVANGSDELLGLLFPALFAERDAPLCFPDVTYSFYPSLCRLFGIGWETFRLTDRWEVDPARIPTLRAGLILPNPNAPTGLSLGLDQIAEMAASTPALPMVVDEAYFGFGSETAVPLIADHPNLLVTRTLSKSHCLAGLRIGYGIGSPEMIEAVNQVRYSFNPYSLDRIATAAGAEAVRDQAYYQSCAARLMATREAVAAELPRLGYDVVSSKANFLWVAHPTWEGPKVVERFAAEGVMVRAFIGERTGRHFRLSIGTEKEMETFLAVARKLSAG